MLNLYFGNLQLNRCIWICYGLIISTLFGFVQCIFLIFFFLSKVAKIDGKISVDIALKKKNVYNPVEVMNMSKEVKTNAMRMLDKHHIQYDMIQYECDEFIDGLHTAQATGAPVEQSFKTLVAKGKSGGYYVFVIPIAEEVDLKAAARSVGEKSVEMIHVKDITAITGYVRGGCSPLGMKKQFPTVIHESAEAYPEIYVSGGRIGTSIKVEPQALAKVARAKFDDIIRKAE